MKQCEAGLYNYTPGNILLLHVDEAKTREMFKKKRNYWNKLGEFVGYVGMSKIIVRVFGSRKDITLPIYFSKFLAPNRQVLQQYDLSKFGLLGTVRDT
jgi:hypothetical protein